MGAPALAYLEVEALQYRHELPKKDLGAVFRGPDRRWLGL